MKMFYINYHLFPLSVVYYYCHESPVLELGEMLKKEKLLPLVACVTVCVVEWMSLSFISVGGHPVVEEGHPEMREVEGGNSLGKAGFLY